MGTMLCTLSRAPAPGLARPRHRGACPLSEDRATPRCAVSWVGHAYALCVDSATLGVLPAMVMPPVPRSKGTQATNPNPNPNPNRHLDQKARKEKKQAALQAAKRCPLSMFPYMCPVGLLMVPRAWFNPSGHFSDSFCQGAV